MAALKRQRTAIKKLKTGGENMEQGTEKSPAVTAAQIEMTPGVIVRITSEDQLERTVLKVSELLYLVIKGIKTCPNAFSFVCRF